MSTPTLVDLYSETNNQLLAEHQAYLHSLIPHSVKQYYQLLLSLEETARFLSNELVEDHLQNALAEWMQLVLSPKQADEIAELDQRHQTIGQVHARINVDMNLVSQAMMVLKNSLYDGLMKQAPVERDLILLVHNILDYALISINSAYFDGYESMSHQSQVLHNHLSSMDFALEIQQMRTELHRWFSNCLINGQVNNVQETDVALWIRHKLPLAVQDKNAISAIDDMLSQLETQMDGMELLETERLEQAKTVVNDLSWNLEELSKQLIQTSEKKDPLTKVYNRRFLDTILLQETMRSQRMQKNYSIVMLDVDHFKRINDHHGHDAGDNVLATIGELINQYIRVSDFAFRFGGEEFLLVLTECNANKAQTVSQKISNVIANHVFKTSNANDLQVTISAGVAEFDGQPDYQHTIKKADQALYFSKENGRNRVTAWEQLH